LSTRAAQQEASLGGHIAPKPLRFQRSGQKRGFHRQIKR